MEVSEHIIQVLKSCIERSDYKRFKLGAVILDKKGRIISKGWNSQKTHPMQYRYALKANEHKTKLHAEIAALVKCRDEPHTIIVMRQKKDGSYGLAKPCPSCQLAIQESGIKTIVYSTDGGFESFDL